MGNYGKRLPFSSPLEYPSIWYLVGISRVVSGTWTPLATIVFSHDHFRELPCPARFHFLPALILPSPSSSRAKNHRIHSACHERETTIDSSYSIFRCSSNTGINIDARKISIAFQTWKTNLHLYTRVLSGGDIHRNGNRVKRTILRYTIGQKFVIDRLLHRFLDIRIITYRNNRE